MEKRLLVLITVCLLCISSLPVRILCAAESQPFLQAALRGEATRESGPASGEVLTGTEHDAKEDLIGFDTPEQAVVAYLDGLKNADLEQMLTACADDIFVDRQNFALLLNNMHAFPTPFIYIPNTNSFFRDASFEVRRGVLARFIALQYATVLIPELNMDGKVFPIEGEKAIDEFLTLFSEERLDELASLVILDVVKASEWEGIPETYQNQANMNALMLQARTHGADGFENIIATFRVGGRDFRFFPMVCRYDDRWLITDLMGNVARLLDLSFFSGGVLQLE